MLYLAIEKRRRLVQLDPTPMARFGKWNLLRVEVVPAGSAHHFIREIAQNILYRVGRISDSRIEREI